LLPCCLCFFVSIELQQETLAAFGSSINTKTPHHTTHSLEVAILPGFFLPFRRRNSNDNKTIQSIHQFRSLTMIILRDPQQITQVFQPDIKAFIQQRFHDICDPEPYNPDEHGIFILESA
jgi:hypothetical protein